MHGVLWLQMVQKIWCDTVRKGILFSCMISCGTVWVQGFQATAFRKRVGHTNTRYILHVNVSIPQQLHNG